MKDWAESQDVTLPLVFPLFSRIAGFTLFQKDALVERHRFNK